MRLATDCTNVFFKTGTNWTKLNSGMGQMCLTEPPASLSRWICSLMSLCSSSSCLDPSSLNRAICWKWTQKKLQWDAHADVVCLVYISLSASLQATHRCHKTFWTVPPAGHGIHPTFLKFTSIENTEHMSSWLNTEARTLIFIHRGFLNKSAPSHATSPNGWADNYEIALYVI